MMHSQMKYGMALALTFGAVYAAPVSAQATAKNSPPPAPVRADTTKRPPMPVFAKPPAPLPAGARGRDLPAVPAQGPLLKPATPAELGAVAPAAPATVSAPVESAPAAAATAESVPVPAAAPLKGVEAGAKPAGATMLCKDGTYLSTTPSETACDTHGGLTATFTVPQARPPRPAL